MMELKRVENKRIGEACYTGVHSSGLKICLYPKEGYVSTYALFETRYGSVDTRFKRSDEDEYTEVPAGIAHFLEHKLFESEDGDAFARYAETGASANAFTSFDQTGYLFSCSENFGKAFEILLDFVQKPYFTEQTVEKEQGIIGQEIKMYDDSPPWRVFFNLLGGLYHSHPVRIDIAGTVESIAKIDAALLYRCYHTFYNLHNMVLTVVGKFDRDEVEALCDRLLKPAADVRVDSVFSEEPEEIRQRRVEQRFPIAVPLFNIGFKESCGREPKTPAQLAATEILLECISGNHTPLYRSLLEQGLINATFGSEYFNGPGYAAVILGGESANPDEVYRQVCGAMERLKKEGLDRDSFERSKKAVYARRVADFNSIESIAQNAVESMFDGYSIYDIMEAVAACGYEEANARLREQMDPGRSVLSLVLPMEERKVE